MCPTEIIAFSDRVDEFRKLDTEVIAASVDSHFTHLAWLKTPRKEGGLGMNRARSKDQHLSRLNFRTNQYSFVK